MSVSGINFESLGGSGIPLAQKGAAEGVATLNSETKLPIAQVPKSNAGGYYEATFGNASATSFTIEHKLNTLTPNVNVINQSTSLEEGCKIEIINANKVKLSATAWEETPPGIAAYRVSVDASSGLVNSSGSSLTNFVEKGEIGANSGVAPLTSGGLLPESRVSANTETITTAPEKWVTRRNTTLNFVTDCGGRGDAVYRKVGTTKESTTVSVSSALSSWVGKAIVGENIAAGTTVSTSVNGGTSITISKAATGTLSESKILIGTDNSAAWETYWGLVTPEGEWPKSSSSPGNIMVPNAGIETIAIFQHELYQPAGIYITTKPESMMKATSARSGMQWLGAGINDTYHVYAPTETNSYAMRNTESVLNINIKGMTFSCLDSTSSFMASVGPTAQNYTFERVNWTGNWKYGIRLTGTNVNSEHQYDHCGIHGYWTSFLSSPSEAEGGSDQFLNYRFISCQVEYRKGNFIDMASGGSIDIIGCSLIHFGNGENEQIFVAMRTKERNKGVCRLNINGIRVEHRHPRSKLLYWEPEEGTIVVDSYDGSTVNAENLPLTTSVKTELESEAKETESIIQVKSTTGIIVGMNLVFPNDITEKPDYRQVKKVTGSHEVELNEALKYKHLVNAVVEQATRPQLTPVEIIYPKTLLSKFTGCMMPGRHVYGYEAGLQVYSPSLIYDTCRLVDWEYAARTGFVVTRSIDGTLNEGTKPPVKFRDCLSVAAGAASGTNKRLIDGVVNGSITARGTRRDLHTVVFKTAKGGLPSTELEPSIERFIHSESTIVAVRSKKGAVGTNTSKTWKYKLLDGSNSNAVIAEVKGNGEVEWKTGWAFEEKLNLHTSVAFGSSPSWLLTLSEESVAEANPASWFEVDYIA